MNWFFTKSKIDPTSLLVLGDSHCRAYAFNRNFVPLFLGMGKTHCFISKETEQILKKDTAKAMQAIPGNRVLLVLGEPDTRYYLGKGWYPWKNELQPIIKNKSELVTQSIVRYERYLRWLRLNYNNEFIVCSVVPTIRKQQNEICDLFNQELRNICSFLQLSFIDINNYLYQSPGILNRKYAGDEVHLNQYIQPFVEKELIRIGYLTESYFDPEQKLENQALKSQFKYSRRFGCYVLK